MAKQMILFLWIPLQQATQSCSCVMVISISPWCMGPKCETGSEILFGKDVMEKKATCITEQNNSLHKFDAEPVIGLQVSTQFY